jgi:hypothetical protein
MDGLLSLNLQKDFDHEITAFSNNIKIVPLPFDQIAQAVNLLNTLEHKELETESLYSILGNQSLLSIWHEPVLIGLIFWKIENFLAILDKAVLETSQLSSLNTDFIIKVLETLAKKHLCSHLLLNAKVQRNFDVSKEGYLRLKNSSLVNISPVIYPLLKKISLAFSQVLVKDLDNFHEKDSIFQF